MIVLTGGPGAGKTAILELARHQLCAHVAVLPEAAGILFSGGFIRRPDEVSRRAAQRAIFHVQHEPETIANADPDVAVTLCDRGTIDGLAYWPAGPEPFFEPLGTTRERELGHYAAVIHLRTPSTQDGYHRDPVRQESVREAHEIDRRIEAAWSGHPRIWFVDSEPDFMDKARLALARIVAELPVCCQG